MASGLCFPINVRSWAVPTSDTPSWALRNPLTHLSRERDLPEQDGLRSKQCKLAAVSGKANGDHTGPPPGDTGAHRCQTHTTPALHASALWRLDLGSAHPDTEIFSWKCTSYEQGDFCPACVFPGPRDLGDGDQKVTTLQTESGHLLPPATAFKRRRPRLRIIEVPGEASASSGKCTSQWEWAAAPQGGRR